MGIETLLLIVIVVVHTLRKILLEIFVWAMLRISRKPIVDSQVPITMYDGFDMAFGVGYVVVYLVGLWANGFVFEKAIASISLVIMTLLVYSLFEMVVCTFWMVRRKMLRTVQVAA